MYDYSVEEQRTPLTYQLIVRNVQVPQREVQNKEWERMKQVMAQVQVPQSRTDATPTVERTGTFSNQLVVGCFDILQVRILLPQLNSRQGGQLVVRNIQRLQQWHLEEVGRDGGQLVVRKVNVSEILDVHSFVLQERSQKHW